MRSLKLAAYFCGTKIREKNEETTGLCAKLCFPFVEFFLLSQGKKKSLSRETNMLYAQTRETFNHHENISIFVKWKAQGSSSPEIRPRHFAQWYVLSHSARHRTNSPFTIETASRHPPSLSLPFVSPFRSSIGGNFIRLTSHLDTKSARPTGGF